MKPLPTLFLCAAGLLGWTVSDLAASSTAAPAADFAALTAAAEWIAEFQVVDKRCALLADGSIETRYTFSTLTPMKGAIPSMHEVRIPGGVVAGRGLHLPGLPEWATGDRAILFLSSAGPVRGWRMPVGLGAGAFRVIQDGSGRARVRAASAADGPPLVHDYDHFVAAVLAETGSQASR
ncbi:MAG TPA: hypothetical protein VGC54_06380 [Planctomycetota bacterium]